jgi:hypothetical protein
MSPAAVPNFNTNQDLGANHANASERFETEQTAKRRANDAKRRAKSAHSVRDTLGRSTDPPDKKKAAPGRGLPDAACNPGLTVLDVLADMFAGDESDRAQVRQFVNLLKRLARKHHCAILLLSHPSLTGMNTGSGLSGSTDWNNAVRSRLYLQTPRTDEGAMPNKNLRTFQGMKSNYGERGGKFDVVWREGVFVRLQGPADFDRLAAERKSEEVYLASLKRRNYQFRTVSDRPGPNYAPAVFAKEPAIAAGITVKQLEAAMERLFKAGKIRVEIKGPPSRQVRSIVLAEEL